MKKIVLFLLVVVTAFVGCQNTSEGNGGNQTKQYVQIERDTLYLGCEGGSESLFLESHSKMWDYTYDNSQEWCLVYDNIDSFGNRVLVVEATENDTNANRELTVVVTNGEAADELVVVQLADDSKPATTINVAQSVYSITKESAMLDVEVESNGDYEVVIPAECSWLMHDGTAAEGGKRVESFYVTANYGDDVRTATIEFKSLNTTTQIEVRQWGNIDLMVDAEAKTLMFLAGRDSIHVETISEYTVKIAEGDWVSVNTELSSDEWVVFDYTENTAEEESRTAVITIATARTTKNITLTQVASNLTEMPEADNWVDDIAVTITSVEATSQRANSNKADRVCDGNLASSWISAPKNDAPQELVLNVDASNVECINYLRYVPTPLTTNVDWGRWKQTEIYVTDADGVETLVHSTDFAGGVNTVEVLFEPALPNTITKVRIVVKSAVPYVENGTEYPNVASAAEVGLYMFNPEGFKNALDYFTDWSLSEIRSDVTYDQLAEIRDPFYRSLAERIYLGTYDDEFRVSEFYAYPHPERDADEFRDTAFSPLDNATGMFVPKAGDTQYIYLDEDYGLEIYVRVVDYVNNEDAVGNSATNHQYDYRLQKGRNVITPKYRGLMYLIAITDDYKNIPPMKAHFVNAGVNGYIKKGVHSAEDVARIFGLASKLVEPRFDVLSDRAIINFSKDLFRQSTFQNNPREYGHRVFELMDAYDTMVNIVEDFEGFTKYGRRHTHRVMIHEGETNNAGYSAYGHICARKGVGFWVNPDEIWPRKAPVLTENVVKSGWTLFHEFGHATQTRLFKWCGLTEVTNNFMCNIIQNTLYGEGLGYTDLRYGDHFNRGMRDMVTRWVWDFDENGNWFERPWVYSESVNSPSVGYEKSCVDYQTRIMPFYQLYLYYHLVKGNKDFYPDFYEVCRTKDLHEKYYKNGHEYNSAVLVEYVKTISEVSGDNLSHWADAWGIPGVNRAMGVNPGLKVNHYQEIFFKTTEEDVAALKEYCSQFKPLDLDPLYIHDLNLDLYRNPQPVTAGTHTYDGKGKFTTSGWQSVVAWVLVDPDKKDENGEMGRVVAILQCDNPNGNDSFEYAYKESRYIPKAADDYSDYFYNEGTSYSSSKKGTERSLEPAAADYTYTQSLQLYAVDAYGKRYASQSNTK